jgi:hypothetical protein
MDFTTNVCSAYGTRDFRLIGDPSIPVVDVQWLAALLTDSVANGTRFISGQTIELGSLLLRLELLDDVLLVTEPDFMSMPIVWTRGVNNTLRIIRLQKDIADSVSLGDEMESQPLCTSLILGSDLQPGATNLVLERVDPATNDSGWFIGDLNAKIDYSIAKNLRRVSVYEAVVNWPQIAGFLALPDGSRVEIRGQTATLARNGTTLPLLVDSLLAQVNQWRIPSV